MVCQNISKNLRPEINFTGNLFLRHFPFSEINICENDSFDFTSFLTWTFFNFLAHCAILQNLFDPCSGPFSPLLPSSELEKYVRMFTKITGEFKDKNFKVWIFLPSVVVNIRATLYAILIAAFTKWWIDFSSFTRKYAKKYYLKKN